jgi:sugar/nucleoside kinase (ribokinase family)
MPPYALATKLTGAGDTFMAAHIAAELSGTTGEVSLQLAANAASNYVSGKSENQQ